MYLYISYQLSQRKTIMATLHHPSSALLADSVDIPDTQHVGQQKNVRIPADDVGWRCQSRIGIHATWLIIVSQQCQPI